MSKRGFLIFWIFLLFFFWNFLARVECEWNSGLKFFSLFLSLSQLGLDRNKVRMVFFTFLNFFAIFLGVFYPGSGWKGIQNEIFSLSFSADLNPVWIEITPRWCFFFTFFECFCYFYGNSLSRVGWEPNWERNFFFSFSAYLNLVWIETMPEWSFLIF